MSNLIGTVELPAMDVPATGIVPEGQPTIAQRFSVGLSRPLRLSPEGTAEKRRVSNSAVPSGLEFFTYRSPNAEALGYFQASLRDDLSVCYLTTN